ncbi:hypothetical protein [Calidifontibacter indicus]|uniref:hypothetical protein n=1 Tax=Calidifontibacter indicus TaxID=419650 RepID=UPI003D740BF0
MTKHDGVNGDLRGLIGRQRPTHQLVAPYERTLADAAIGLMADCGKPLREWQQDGLREGMGINGPAHDYRWAAYEVSDICSRRNGKTVKLEARALAGLFLLGEVDILWTAHRYDTVLLSFTEVARLIKSNPDLRSELLPKRNEGIVTQNGVESITTRSGATINFRTRGPDTGRGFDGDLLIVDESQAATPEQMKAMSGTLINGRNPQIWYSGSAGGAKSHVLGDLVHRALNTEPGDEARERLTFNQWAADEDDDPSDPRVWAKVNPSYGLPGSGIGYDNLRAKYIELKYRPHEFAQEHLGVGTYPRPESETWVVPSVDWTRREDPDSFPVGKVLLAAHASPDQSWASIGMAGHRTDGAVHLQLVAHDRGTRWIVERLAELQETFDTVPEILVTERGPLGYLVSDMEAIGLKVRLMTSEEQQNASSWFITNATEPPPEELAEQAKDGWPGWVRSPRHLGQPPLTVALAEVSIRTVGERYVLSSRAPIDVSPIIAAAYAGYGLELLGRAPAPPPSPELVSERFGPSRPTGIGGANF